MIAANALASGLASVVRGPRMTRVEVEHHQSRRLRALVAHAHATVPYYRRLFDQAGVSPERIRTTEDLGALPITEKSVLRSLPAEEVISSRFDPDRLIQSRTSGSSGTPLIVRRRWIEQNLLYLYSIRAWRSVGLKARDLRVGLGVVRRADPSDAKVVGSAVRSLGLYRRSVVDVFLPPEEALAQLEKVQPDVLHGYPSGLARVADLVHEKPSTNLQPRLLMAGAEVLTAPLKRRIEAGFGAPVYNMYGCHELNLVASECQPTGEMHTCDDALILEVVLEDGRPASEGERGEVVVTGLYSYGMPFIRYRLGDVVTQGHRTCSCGAPFSTIRQIEGRAFECFELPGGRSVHAHQLGLRLMAEAGDRIKQYQLVQERLDHVVLRIVPEEASPPDPDLLRGALGELLGPRVDVSVVFEPDLPPDATGKTRHYRSLIGGGAH